MNHTTAALSSASRRIVFVVDDVAAARQELEALIRSAGWLPKTFASGEEFLAHPRLLTPSCLVLCVPLRDLDALHLQRLLADRSELPVIFVTSCVDIPTTVQAVKAGAVEFLTRPFDEETLLNALRQALERSCEALNREAEMRTLRDRYVSLSSREREVMTLVVAGRLNKQVGAELGISDHRQGASGTSHAQDGCQLPRGARDHGSRARFAPSVAITNSRLYPEPASSPHARLQSELRLSTDTMVQSASGHTFDLIHLAWDRRV